MINKIKTCIRQHNLEIRNVIRVVTYSDVQHIDLIIYSWRHFFTFTFIVFIKQENRFNIIILHVLVFSLLLQTKYSSFIIVTDLET